MKEIVFSDVRKVWEALHWNLFQDARVIADKCGIDRGRTVEAVRAAIRWMRIQGLPIVSGQDGYKKTTDPTELATCAQTMFRKADSTRQRGDELLNRIAEGWGPAAYEALADDILFAYGDSEEQ